MASRSPSRITGSGRMALRADPRIIPGGRTGERIVVRAGRIAG